MALFSPRRKGPPDGAGSTSEASIASAEAESAAEPRPSRRRTVGQLLRETRESYGNDLARVATALRIRGAYLEAIEAGHYDHLPGPVYALGFVRAYAVYLGLDGEEAVRRFKLEAEGFEGQRDLSFPVPLAERSIPGGAMLLVAIILAICGYGLWYYLSSSARPRLERVSPVPAQLNPPMPTAPVVATPPPAPSGQVAAPAPVSPTAVAPTPPPSAPIAPEPAASAPADTPAVAAAPPPAPVAPSPAVPEKPAPMADLTAVISPPSSLAVVAAPVPAPPSAPEGGAAPVPDGPRVYGLANGETRIIIRAISDSWIQVRDRDRIPLFTRQLHTGDTYRVPDRPGLSMRTGKGAGLAITVDGRQTPPIGGAVRSNVALDPDRLLAGTAVGE